MGRSERTGDARRNRRAWHLTALGLCALLCAVAVSTARAESQGGTASPPTQGIAIETREPRNRDVPTAGPRDVTELLFAANQAYLDGAYAEAARGYQRILALGHRNGHVYYNLANCWVRLGHIGRAILNYRKARLLLPRDGDIEANLTYARSLSRDRIERRSSLWRTLAFWYFGLSVRGLLTLLLLFNAAFWGAAVAHLFRESEWIKWTLALAGILTLTFALSTGLKVRETFRNPEGVLLVEEANVRAGFSHRDTVLFVLHEGAEFRILGEENGWWKIALPDGKKGWVPADAGGRVSLGT